MLTETGRVVAIESDAVWVETIRSSLCGSCAARSGCGHGVLARASEGRGLVRALASEAVPATACEIDDEVSIALPEAAILRGSMMVYLLPLILGIVMALAVSPLGEVAGILGFCCGLAGGFLMVRWQSRSVGGRSDFEPRLTAVNKRAIIASG